MARSFNGSSDYITLASGFDGGATPFSMAAWVYWNGAAAGSIICSNAAGGAEFRLSAGLLISTTQVNDLTSTATTIPTNTWTHVGCTLDSSKNWALLLAHKPPAPHRPWCPRIAKATNPMVTR